MSLVNDMERKDSVTCCIVPANAAAATAAAAGSTSMRWTRYHSSSSRGEGGSSSMAVEEGSVTGTRRNCCHTHCRNIVCSSPLLTSTEANYLNNNINNNYINNNTKMVPMSRRVPPPSAAYSSPLSSLSSTSSTSPLSSSQSFSSFSSSPLSSLSSHRKPLWLWGTFFLCICLHSAVVTSDVELKLNDIQSYLKSLDAKVGSNTEPVSLMWGIGDTTAFVGRLFSYTIPSDAFKGDIQSFKVTEAGKEELPKWLFFSPESRIFFGVPKPADIAQYYIEVVGQAADGAFAKDVFSIHVAKESSPVTAIPTLKRTNGPSPPVVRCMHKEPETAFTLIVDADMELLSPPNIVGLLKNLERHLDLVSEMFKVSPAGNKPLFDTSALVSGPGNTKTAKHPGVLVTWLVGCGKVEPEHMPILQKVEAISANGSLSEAIGHGIIGWHVTNNQIQEKRVRRAVIMSTPAVSVVAPTIMIKPNGNDGMTHHVPTMESPVIQPTRIHHRTKTRHPDGMTTMDHIQPSTTGPMEGGPMKTKSLPDGMYTMTGVVIDPTRVVATIGPTKPAGGTMTAIPDHCSPGRDHRPRVANRISMREFVAGQVMSLNIPSNTFVDCEENSNELKLEYFLKDYNLIPPKHWLQVDKKGKHLIGLPLKSNVGILNMTVVAMDKDGQKESLDFSIKVIPDPSQVNNAITHMISMQFGIDYEKFMSDINMKVNLLKKIAKLYGDRNPDNISVLDIVKGSVVFSWTNNTLVRSSCPKKETEELLMKLIDDKKQVSKAAYRAMRPYKLLSAQITPMGPCTEGYIPIVPSSTLVVPVSHDPTLTRQDTKDDNDILISTVVPAVIIVSILLLALLVACILYRKKRKGKMSLSEQDAYPGKGAPVIFTDELEEKPTDCQRPLILDDEKPPHPPPEYHPSSSESAQSSPNNDRRGNDDTVTEPIINSGLYEPPPPVTASGKKQHRPHVQPPHRTPPPYVPP